MAYLSKALVACCECRHRQVLVNLITRCGLKPVIATNASDAIALLGSGAVCVTFCQDDLPGGGFETVLKAANQAAVPVVVCSRLADSSRYLESMLLIWLLQQTAIGWGLPYSAKSRAPRMYRYSVDFRTVPSPSRV